jgi:hypothetical protein
MHLLYLDHAGAVEDPSQKHFVLAGISVFERQTYWLSHELDEIAARFNPADPPAVELHGSPMHGGRGSGESSKFLIVSGQFLMRLLLSRKVINPTHFSAWQ